MLHEVEELSGQTLSSSPDVHFQAQVVRSSGGRWIIELLTRRSASGSEGTRRIEGASCADVTRAAVVAMALALEAASEPKPEDDVEPAMTEKMAPRAPSSEAPGAESSEPKRSAPLPLRPELHAGATLDSAALPSGTLGALAGFGVEVGRVHFQLDGLFFPDSEVSTGTGGGEFRLLAASLGACFAVPVAGWTALPCLRYELGSLRGEGTRVRAPRPRTALWSALGGYLGAALPLARNWRLGIEGGAILPLTRPSFLLDDPEPIHEVPRLGFRGNLAVSWFF